MLKRLIICLFLIGAPLTVAAQTFQDVIVSQLQAQGFSNISTKRTWLGRIRLVAFRDDLRRELVFNPQTGEILRDYWRTLDDDDDISTPRLINPGESSDSGGESDKNDDADRDDDVNDNSDDDRDEEDDEDEKDESDDEEDDSDDDEDEKDDSDDDEDDKDDD